MIKPVKSIAMKYTFAIPALIVMFNLFITHNIFAQKTVFGIPHSQLVNGNNFRQFYFLDVGFLTGSEVYRGIPDAEFTQTRPYVTNANLDESKYQGIGWGVLGMRINQRVNIFEYNDLASLSVVLPMQFTYALHGITLFAPITLQTNFFWRSTKTELDNYGFNLGIGYGRIRLILADSDEVVDSFNKNIAGDRFFLLNAGLSFRSPINNEPRRIDYWIGRRPTLISHAGDNTYLSNFYFSIAYSTRFFFQ